MAPEPPIIDAQVIPVAESKSERGVLWIGLQKAWSDGARAATFAYPQKGDAIIASQGKAEYFVRIVIPEKENE